MASNALFSQTFIGQTNSFMKRAAAAFPELALQDILDFLHQTQEGKICWQAMQTDKAVIHFTQLCQTIAKTYPELNKYLVGIIHALKNNKVEQATTLAEKALQVSTLSNTSPNETNPSSSF